MAGARTGERDDSGFPVFTLHYDSYQTFEEANHDVSFVDKYRLVHLEDGAEMTWKREGEEVDREAVMASLADEAVDLQEVRSSKVARYLAYLGAVGPQDYSRCSGGPMCVQCAFVGVVVGESSGGR